MISEGSRARSSFIDVWTTWMGRADRSLKKRGFLGTVQAAAAIFKYKVINGFNRLLLDPWMNYWCRVFDRRFGVDTAGSIFLPELQSDPRFKNSLYYDPTPRSLFFRMLRQLDVDYSRFVFVDFGCGKGKALLLAAELPFKQIIGVELSPKLLGIAESNLKSYISKTRKSNIFQLACMDAAEYQVPREPAVYYFYYPFQAQVMCKVMEGLRSSLAAAPREAYVMCYSLPPEVRRIVDNSGFLMPIKQTSHYSIYKASGA